MDEAGARRVVWITFGFFMLLSVALMIGFAVGIFLGRPVEGVAGLLACAFGTGLYVCAFLVGMSKAGRTAGREGDHV